MNNNIGIYILEWDNCNHYYIGQSRNLRARKIKHLNTLKNKKHDNSRLNHTFNKYGLPTFRIVQYCEVQNLDTTEQYYLNIYFKDPYCCNLSKNVVSFKDHKHSEECKKLIGQKSKLKIYSKEYRSKLSEAQKIRFSDPKNIIRNKPSEYQKLIASQTHKNKPKSLDQKLKMSINNKNAKIILDIDTGVYYNNVTELSKLLKRDRSYLSQQIKNNK